VNLASLLEEWAAKFDVQTVLERAVGNAAPACVALAARGARVVAVVDDPSGIGRARAAYGPDADVRVAGAVEGDGGADLPRSDLVVVHGAAPGSDWREALRAFGKHAAKLVVVEAENPGTWKAELTSRWARLRGGEADGADGWGRTDALAPVLWEMGRVREHAFLDVPPVGVGRPGLARRVAPAHAFVVDVTPRSPQARRRLRLETA
jgi:hypothetical protein